MKEPTFSIQTRSTDMGAQTYAIVVDRFGEIVRPERVESSKTGKHGEELWYRDLSDCLILVVEISNSGKDHSYVHQVPEVLTSAQERELCTFKEMHYL